MRPSASCQKLYALWLSIFLTASAPFSAQARGPQCEDIWRRLGSRDALVQRIRDFRISQLGTPHTDALWMNGVHYPAIAELGQANGRVSLVRSPKGRNIVFKEMGFNERDDHVNHRAALAYYEATATLFFESMGYPIPRLLDISVEIGRNGRPSRVQMTKEYVEGITRSELQSADSPIRDRDEVARLIREEQREVARINRDIFGRTRDSSEFSRWLERNVDQIHRDFPELAELDSYIRESEVRTRWRDRYVLEGDISTGDMVWSATSRRWILIDP